MHPLTRRIADVLALQPDASAIEYNGDWSTWRQISELANRIAVVGDTEVGVLLRNSPAHVAALLGVLLSGGTVVTINPSRGDDRTRDDLGYQPDAQRSVGADPFVVAHQRDSQGLG